jgi:hypothetical protein
MEICPSTRSNSTIFTGRTSSTRQAQQPQTLAQALEEVGGLSRQIIESVDDELFSAFGLWRERLHELSGLRARLAARVALHNLYIWLNEQLGRPRQAFADLLGC